MSTLLTVLLPILKAIVAAVMPAVFDELRRPGRASFADVDVRRRDAYRRHFRRLRTRHQGIATPLVLALVALSSTAGCTHWEGIIVPAGGYAYLAKNTRAELLVPKDDELVRVWGTIPAGWVVMAPPEE